MTTSSRTNRDIAGQRAPWKAVAIPTEHGGWGLTLEPVILGLFVKPSIAGALLGVAAFITFVARTPLKAVLVDSRRGRNLERTTLARQILAGEVLLLIALAAGAVVLGDLRWWVPAIAAIPLAGVELWFDMRSKSRRLTPELAGAVGVSAVAAVIVLAAGASYSVAASLWMVLAARAITSIPFVRSQVALLHKRTISANVGFIADAVAVTIATAAYFVQEKILLGSIAIGVIIVYQRISGKWPPDRAAILGVRQTVVGLTLVLVTALGVLLP